MTRKTATWCRSVFAMRVDGRLDREILVGPVLSAVLCCGGEYDIMMRRSCLSATRGGCDQEALSVFGRGDQRFPRGISFANGDVW
jgi:hypothetical protein